MTTVFRSNCVNFKAPWHEAIDADFMMVLGA